MYKKRILVILSLLLLAVPTMVGCSRSAAVPGAVIDGLGRSVSITKAPQRIVSIGASTTEILYALKLGDRIVGTDKYSDYPAETAALPKMDAFSSPATITEVIVGWQPDAVFAMWYTMPDWATSLQARGIPVFLIAPRDIEGVMSSIELIGKATGSGPQAAELAATMRRDVKAVADRTANAPRPKIFYELDGTDPTKPWTSGPGSLGDALIKIAGGDNIAASGSSEGFQMSAEAVISANPDIILLGDVVWGTTQESVIARPGWSGMKAVKDRRIYAIDSDIASRAGPRIVQSLQEFARNIHSELYK